MNEKLGEKLVVQKMLLWNEHTLKCSELCYWINYVEQWQKLCLNVGIKEINMSMPLKHAIFLYIYMYVCILYVYI